MTPQLALILIMFIPAFAAMLIPLARRWPNVREAISITAGLALLATIIWLVRFVGLSPDNRPGIILDRIRGQF